MPLSNVSFTDTAIATLFEQLAAPSKMIGIDYTGAFYINDNIQRLYNRLYPYIMKDFVHQKDYNTFVKITKSHTHKVVGHKLTLPSKSLAPFKPLTPFIYAATVMPEPWSGILTKISPLGIILSPMYAGLREVVKTTVKLDKTKKSYI